MTNKKAIQILDYLIEKKAERKSDFLDPKHSWNQGNEKILKDTISIISGFMQDEIYSLQTIRKELVPDCTHPPEMQDICEGQKYCMDCNMDL